VKLLCGSSCVASSDPGRAEETASAASTQHQRKTDIEIRGALLKAAARQSATIRYTRKKKRSVPTVRVPFRIITAAIMIVDVTPIEFRRNGTATRKLCGRANP
jgi:hypothetical protein